MDRKLGLMLVLLGAHTACGDSGGSEDEGYGGDAYGAGGGAAEEGGSGPSAPPPSAIPPEDVLPEGCEGIDQSAPLVLYLSADDSNSMASPARARESLVNGSASVGSIRTYEFFNYYRIDYPAPPEGELALFAEADTEPAPGEFALQLAVRSYDAPAQRRPMTITFVLDTSGSMSGRGIEHESAAIAAIASQLNEGDIVNAVTWDTDQNVLLDGHEATGPNDPTVIALAQNLEADGATDLESGLEKGYALALQNYEVGNLNRLVLISDGGANVGVTAADLIGEHAELNDGEGIYLVGIGTGGDAYSDELMDIVTDAGRGAYVFLDSPEEATAILADRFDEVMDVAARGVQIELTLPWYFQMKKFYGEEYSEDPKEVKPQHLAPGDSMVLLQTLRSCDPTQIDMSDAIKLKATWTTPLTHVPLETTIETTLGDLLAAPKPHLGKGRAIAAYADALRSADGADLSIAAQAIAAANPDGSDPELNEIAGLLSGHPNAP